MAKYGPRLCQAICTQGITSGLVVHPIRKEGYKEASGDAVMGKILSRIAAAEVSTDF